VILFLLRDWASAMGETAWKCEKERTAPAAADFLRNSLRLQLLLFVLTEASFVEVPTPSVKVCRANEETTPRI
jgi:hypothetical protein